MAWRRFAAGSENSRTHHRLRDVIVCRTTFSHAVLPAHRGRTARRVEVPHPRCYRGFRQAGTGPIRLPRFMTRARGRGESPDAAAPGVDFSRPASFVDGRVAVARGAGQHEHPVGGVSPPAEGRRRRSLPRLWRGRHVDVSWPPMSRVPARHTWFTPAPYTAAPRRDRDSLRSRQGLTRACTPKVRKSSEAPPAPSAHLGAAAFRDPKTCSHQCNASAPPDRDSVPGIEAAHVAQLFRDLAARGGSP